jgi:hypothetical protein
MKFGQPAMPASSHKKNPGTAMPYIQKRESHGEQPSQGLGVYAHEPFPLMQLKTYEQLLVMS